MRLIIITLSLIFFIPFQVFSQKNNFSPFACTLTGLGEVVIPGLGYLITKQYAKAVVFGGIRYAMINEAEKASEELGFQEESEEYYYDTEIKDKELEMYDFLEQEDKEEGKSLSFFVYNKSTFNYEIHRQNQTNLGLYSFWDISEGQCNPHDQSLDPFLAFSDVKTYGTSPIFWGVMLAIGTNVFYLKPSDVSTWHLGNGLKFSQVKRDSYLSMYGVGIGEETLFRGVIQKDIYQFYRSFMSPQWAWHLGVVTSSVIFGLAHDGGGTSANSQTAFFGGIVLGYAYQPLPDTFELSTAIVIHTLWNAAVTYYYFSVARKVVETEESVNIESVKADPNQWDSKLEIPIFNFHLSF